MLACICLYLSSANCSNSAIPPFCERLIFTLFLLRLFSMTFIHVIGRLPLSLGDGVTLVLVIL